MWVAPHLWLGAYQVLLALRELFFLLVVFGRGYECWQGKIFWGVQYCQEYLLFVVAETWQGSCKDFFKKLILWYPMARSWPNSKQIFRA